MNPSLICDSKYTKASGSTVFIINWLFVLGVPPAATADAAAAGRASGGNFGFGVGASSFGFLFHRLEFSELLCPRLRRRVAHLVRTNQRTDFWQPVLGTDVRIRVTAADGLL